MTNIASLSEKFFGSCMCIILLVQMRTIVVAMASAVMTILVVSTVAVSTTFAITDNNTDASIRGGENDSSDVLADGTSGNGESPKSGINTTVCGPDPAHACQTSSGGQ
jgi:hypothetical protein